ncbi:glutamine synthetase III [Chitinivibrio alkaliphilus]|uniref:Glutamine synthetase catalytic region n=1 Tax=Chitinivibrio alkaliphilus ACht1 TaxID=1313304 RepID=U7D8R1_9BACT|nr:glutamine synthetase III [Chitinivibrio alkaliphilus]ERP31482.1 glutamine synthetase catalytic region [Chitinivibrio alkaliphilus ACht1]
MSNRREVAAHIDKSRPGHVREVERVSTYYGSNTFSEDKMRKRVPEKVFTAFKEWQNGGEQICSAFADQIAQAMMEWALEKGATSYTHWFQPMTGLTAEKHDSFISRNGKAQVIEQFSGKNLILSEPDASSLPSGGLRTTFEARGYTAWDPSSPAFIREVEFGKTLCIPSIFVSYNGEALDKKLPLLRSEKAVTQAAERLLRIFSKDDVSVKTTCGAEQEFFLIDEGYYRLRPDLQLTGRTLLGAPSAKGQQLEDQYFGSIKDRVLNFMNDVEKEAYKLGIPITTRHNEVAPSQFEFAPIFEDSALAADHNQLLMDILKKIARKHRLVCLLHEKPFAGVNGSGKHINWSLADSRGGNLLNPGSTPHDNIQFLTLLTGIISAVYTHGDILRASVASAGNTHRLGANEAPPAIMSIFLGSQLSNIVDAIVNGRPVGADDDNRMSTGISFIPDIERDQTDRNRTSPFAFTGAKFEFRAVGSEMNISTPLMVINTIVAEGFDALSDALEAAGENLSVTAITAVLQKFLQESKDILFEGDNYSREWEEEAARRNLPNVVSTAKALEAYISKKTISLFERYEVLNSSELHARYMIWLELYNNLLVIEAETLEELVQTEVLPTAYKFQREVGESLRVLRDMDQDDSIPLPIHAVEDRIEMFAHITEDIYIVRKHIHKLRDMLKIISKKSDQAERADYLTNDLTPHFEHIRKHVDHLESTIADDLWELPKYREMLFNL